MTRLLALLLATSLLFGCQTNKPTANISQPSLPTEEVLKAMVATDNEQNLSAVGDRLPSFYSEGTVQLTQGKEENSGLFFVEFATFNAPSADRRGKVKILLEYQPDFPATIEAARIAVLQDEVILCDSKAETIYRFSIENEIAELRLRERTTIVPAVGIAKGWQAR